MIPDTLIPTATWLIATNLTSFLVLLLLLRRPAVMRAYERLPRWLQKALVLFNVGPLLLLPAVNQPRLEAHWSYTLAGGLLCILALTLWGAAMRQIGAIPGLKAKESVVSSSVYGLVRHPIYLGNVLVTVGLGLLARGTLALLYGLVVLAFYILLIRAEEDCLIAEYGNEYRAYQVKVTHRLIPWLY